MKASHLLKQKLSETFILAMHNLDKVFRLKTNASKASVGAILTQECRPVK